MTDSIHLSITLPALSFSVSIVHADWATKTDAERVRWITAIVADQAIPYAKIIATISVPELPKVRDGRSE